MMPGPCTSQQKVDTISVSYTVAKGHNTPDTA